MHRAINRTKSIAPSLCAAASAAGCTMVLFFVTAQPVQAAQQSPPDQTQAPIRITTNVVNVYAVVRDKHGELIPDLAKSDFEIKEDGIPQKVNYFSRETNTPLTLAIMIDTSPSQGRVLDVEQQEAITFLKRILRPKDLACVLHFDLEVELLQDFTNNESRLASAIDGTQINGGSQGILPSPLPTGNMGGTHLYDAIYLASNELMKNQVGRKVLILLTDGQDQGSQVKMDDALDAAQKSDVAVYSINVSDRAFYGNQAMGYQGDSVLKKLSRDTGGRVLGVNNIRKTASAFDEIAQELRAEYLLGYTPSNPRKDSGFRKIAVRITRKGDFKVQARRGYYPH